ncbi:TlpA family protein disulfide reductase [Fulvivirgaceae bacterium LMO-SS25]
MKKISILCFMALLCLVVKAQSQEQSNSTTSTEVTPIEIGQHVPPIVMKEVLNYDQSELSLNEYSGKVIILDFWASWCAPCIQMMPKSNLLQEKYKDDLQIIPITYEDAATASKAISKMEKATGTSNKLPLVVNEKYAHLLFPHQSLPHYVWIDGTGRVLSITSLYGVNEENIERAINRNQLASNAKENRKIVKVYSDEPLVMANTHIKDKEILMQSTLMGYIENAGPIWSYQPFFPEEGESQRVYAVNCSILNLYTMAYSKALKSFNTSKIRIEVADPSPLTKVDEQQSWPEWMVDNSFSYEIIIPPNQTHRTHELIMEDLARYFPQYTVKTEMRVEEVWALVRTSEEEKFASIVDDSDEWEVEFMPYRAYLKNHNMSRLVYELNEKYLNHTKIPVIDKTDYKGKIDILLEVELGKVDLLREALAFYDLDLVKQMAEIEVMVIEDKK